MKLYLTCFVYLLGFNVFANQVEPTAVVCPYFEGYSVKSKTVSYKVEHIATLSNNLGYAVCGHAEFSRTKETVISGNINLELIEDLLGIEAEVSSGTSTTILLSVDPTIPAYSTIYVDFGYRYVSAQIQMFRQNSDCSTSWYGQITSVRYTTEDYLLVRG